MNAFIVVILAIVAASSVVSGQQRQHVDSRNAAILQEARYLQGDGSFGSAYVQDDGVEFKEETQANGDRKGQYSYIDPTGKKITVQYTAGKNGFQVSGDHLPRAPLPVQAPAPVAPQQYNSAPQYNSIPQGGNSYNNNNNGVEDGQYRPEIHEHPYAYNQNNNYQSPPSGSPNAISSFSFSAPQQQQQQFQQQQQPQYYQQTTTPQPTRYFPPGKLDLNRTPDGFQYQFSSNGRQ